MGRIFEEFREELARIERRHAGRPWNEMVALFLLALEREQLVSVSYHEERIARRLGTMPIPEDVRELIRHALIWVWKDEEMHAVYIRSVLLKHQSLPLSLRSYATQFMGGIGGWAGSVRHHVRWADAPVSRALASALTVLGSLSGKVPKEVQRELDYGPFRHFCRFNVDAEKTAAFCWQRLVEKSAQIGMAPDLVEEFRRMWADEENHARVFETFAAALDEQDRLASGETSASIEERIRAIGEPFLPRARRNVSRTENPLGTGGRVHVLRGARAEDKVPTFKKLLDECGLGECLAERARFLGKPVGDLRIALKPTFMLGYDRKDLSPITDPVLMAELAKWLCDLGCADVAVLEARNLYDRFYQNRSVHDVARYFGIASPHFRVVDLALEQVPHGYARGMAQYTVGRTWKEADFRISFGKMRSHSVDIFAFALASLEGLGPRNDAFIFADRSTHRAAAIMTLLADFPAHFALLDGYDLAPDNLMGTMGSARPRTPRRVYAGADAIAVDLVAARHIGVPDPRHSSVLQAACHWFGDPSDRIEVSGLDQPIRGWRGPYHNELTTLLSLLAYPVYQFASGRGALFTPAMDMKAFPPLKPEGLVLRSLRRSLRSLLGLRR